MAVTGRCQIDIETMHLFDGETVAHRSICTDGLGEFNASQQKDAWPEHGHGTAATPLMLTRSQSALLPAKPFPKEASNYEPAFAL